MAGGSGIRCPVLFVRLLRSHHHRPSHVVQPPVHRTPKGAVEARLQPCKHVGLGILLHRLKEGVRAHRTQQCQRHFRTLESMRDMAMRGEIGEHLFVLKPRRGQEEQRLSEQQATSHCRSALNLHSISFLFITVSKCRFPKTAGNKMLPTFALSILLPAVVVLGQATSAESKTPTGTVRDSPT